ncbi:energy transducer TonB [Pseudomonas sp. SL4(2022)]|uniref:energy transducer TonB n=1 Tax=Pseudomonas sp. SL4(2022) TaxID=2994661 RepID=UPI0022700AAB|nr:energy transducer TonB [Pseudomonas sp. SL4(2022)]WAC45079.1 energy transducer TonB [Pseudomonas sp. SL4(2022)]
MLRIFFSLLLSLALHVAGWLLYGVAQPPELNAAHASVQAVQPRITAVLLAPAPVEHKAPAVPPPALPPKPAAVQPVKPAVALQPKPAPLLVPPKQAVAEVAPVEVARTQAVVANPARVESAEPARSRVVAEVFSRRPSFREPPRQPSYPSQARRRNQQGIVLLEVRLDELGQQRSLNVLRSSGVESLDRAALQAVAAWRFSPETTDGQAVPSRVHIPIQFALTASR